MATRTRMTVFIRRNNKADSIVISIERLGKFLPGFFCPIHLFPTFAPVFIINTNIDYEVERKIR